MHCKVMLWFGLTTMAIFVAAMIYEVVKSVRKK